MTNLTSFTATPFSFIKKLFVSLLLVAALSLHASAQVNPAYDMGPNVNTEMGKELVNLFAEFPDYAGISIMFKGEQKFRPAYGAVIIRMLLEPDSVQALVQGQDATHIAEVAGRPATAGFGGRAMDVGRHLGLGPSIGFTNAYAATINGQYGSANSPIVVMNEDGTPKDVVFRSYVDNEIWTMSMDPESRIADFRNKLLSWIFRNNRNSLKLVILFGGASRDAFASFVESRGGKVGTYTDPRSLANFRVPEMRIVSAGGNNQVAYPLTVDGKDLYAEVLGRPLNYKEPQRKPKGYVSDVELARKELDKNIAKWFDKIKFKTGGLGGSSAVHPAQFGGYDIDNQLYVNSEQTVSLKGLKIADDYTIHHDIIVRQFPHPTRLSMMSKEEAAEAVGEPLKVIKYYMDHRGFALKPDPGFVSNFAADLPYEYGRADMGPETYDFGTPKSRMVNVSSAVRLNKSVTAFGTRDKAAFMKRRNKRKPNQVPEYDMTEELKKITYNKPAQYPDPSELWTMRPSGPETPWMWDSGPGLEYSKLMRENIPLELIEKHSVNGDYGHYRGTFKNPKVLIVADPHGYTDLIDSRALTGARGQYLHGLMADMGVGDQYLVLKTAPFAKEAWALDEWVEILEKTKTYREKLIDRVVNESDLSFILTDGEDAAAEVRRILGEQSRIQVIDIKRVESDPSSGIKAAGKQIARLKAFKGKVARGQIADLPRTHLVYQPSRWWQGTSGDLVVTAVDPEFRGKAFAVVAPNWATKQKFEMPVRDKVPTVKLIGLLEQNALTEIKIDECNFIYHQQAQRQEGSDK